MQKWADEFYSYHNLLMYYPVIFVPTISYAVSIGILNAVYRKVAKLLNDFGKSLACVSIINRNRIKV